MVRDARKTVDGKTFFKEKGYHPIQWADDDDEVREYLHSLEEELRSLDDLTLHGMRQMVSDNAARIVNDPSRTAAQMEQATALIQMVDVMRLNAWGYY